MTTVRDSAPPGVADFRFAVPALPPLHVLRQRLITRLDRAEACALILVCAGPGAGKTVLLADWARRCPAPVTWLALTREDDDPPRFWRQFLESAQAAGQEFPPVAWTSGHTVELLDSVYGRSAPGQPRLTVVLDDAHVLTDPGILDGLDRLVARWSHRVQLVLAARSDPLLPLHRYRLAGQSCEIRAVDLAMTTTETRALLRAHDVDLADDDLALLVDRTEGWSAGVRLAALRMQGTPAPAEFVALFAMDQGSIGEYLTQEVLARQPDDVARLLIETSFLDEVSGPLADAITGLPDCGAVLATLARTNSFVIPVDLTRTAFRYHQLFREVLRHLANRQSADRVRLRYSRAAQWYRSCGDLPGAVGWTVRSGDRAAVRQLLVHGGLAEVFVARRPVAATARAELRRIADDEPPAEASAEVRQEFAAARWAIDALTAEPAGRAAALPADLTGAAAQVQVTVVLARLMLGQAAGAADVIDDAAQTLLSSASLTDAVADVRGLRASVLLAQARSRFTAGRFADVEPLLRRALAEAEPDDVPAVHLEILSVLAFVCTSATRMRHAREALDRAAELLAEHPGLPRPVVLDLAVARRAELEADWSTMGAAVDRTLAAGPIHADPGVAGTVAFMQACHLIACGELAQAGALLAHSPALHTPVVGPLGVFRDCRRAEIEILLGRPHTALRLLRQYERSLFAPAAGVTVARAHLALGELAQAQAGISRVLTTPSVFVDRRLTVEALVCGAQIAGRAGEEGRAVDLLDRALQVADGEIVLPFVQARDGLGALLARHPTIAARWPGHPPSPALPGTTETRAGNLTLLDPLTTREEAVLRLMRRPCRRPRSPASWRCPYTPSSRTWPRSTGSRRCAGGGRRCSAPGSSSCSETSHAFRLRCARPAVGHSATPRSRDREGTPVPPRYELRLRELPDHPARQWFADYDVAVEGQVLVVGGELDQSALHGLLERIRVLRLELLDLRRTRGVG
jgi:LuxR family maltose regulon positive regulatory protein